MLDTRHIDSLKSVVTEMRNIVIEVARQNNIPPVPAWSQFPAVMNGFYDILNTSLNYYNAVENGDGEPDQEWYAFKDAIEKFRG